MGFYFKIISIFLVTALSSACTKDNQAPEIDYFIINGKHVTQSIEAYHDDILQLKLSITDEGGLSTHSLKYIVNDEFGDELIYISDEIVNTIVEEFYLDLRNLSRNNLKYSSKSGDTIDFGIEAEDLSNNKLHYTLEVKIK